MTYATTGPVPCLPYDIAVGEELTVNYDAFENSEQAR